MTMYDLNLAWTLLRQQKEWLLRQEGPVAEGLVNLLDSLQDQGAEQFGELLVFGEEKEAAE